MVHVDREVWLTSHRYRDLAVPHTSSRKLDMPVKAILLLTTVVKHDHLRLLEMLHDPNQASCKQSAELQGCCKCRVCPAIKIFDTKEQEKVQWSTKIGSLSIGRAQS